MDIRPPFTEDELKNIKSSTVRRETAAIVLAGLLSNQSIIGYTEAMLASVKAAVELTDLLLAELEK